MGLWDGIESAEVFKKGQYLEPGMYVLKVTRCLHKDTQRAGAAFIAEFEVVESNNPKHAVGSSATWFQSMKDPVRKRMAFSSIKEFIMALYGLDPNNKEDQGKIDSHLPAILERACDESNYLADKLVRVETFHTETKETHKTFTVHRWTPYESEG